MKKNVFFLILLTIIFVGIVPLYAQTNKAASDDALRRMEEAERRLNEALGGGETSATPASGTVQSPAQPAIPAPAPAPPVKATKGGKRPAWVDNPASAYSRDIYITAVGSAPNREEAEKKALAGIVAYFGQSIQSDFTVANIYSEAITNGVINISDNTNVRDVIVTAASMDSLIGAEIGSVWDDGKKTIYVLAFLERARTVAIYTEIIQMNQGNINKLITMSAAQKNTFDGYARYKLAILLAGMNANYVNVVNLAGGSTASLNLTTADSLSLEASNIIKSISVGFTVKGDSNNRVRDTFAKILNAEGIRTQGSNPPYTMEISIDMSEATFPNNTNKFCRYTVSANLIEKSTGNVLVPFNFTDRAAHTTYAEAQNRAFLDIERRINGNYPAAFQAYLAGLMPK